MNISNLLSASLVVLVIFIMSMYIYTKHYQLSISDSFIGGVILGKTDEKRIIDRSIQIDNMRVTNVLKAGYLGTNLINANKVNLLKLCGPGKDNCVVTDDVAMDKASIDALNTKARNTRENAKRNTDRLTDSINNMFSQTEKDISQNRSLLNINIQKASDLINLSSKKIDELFTTVKPMNGETLINLQDNIKTKKEQALTRYKTLQDSFDVVKDSISTKIGNLEIRFSLPPRKLWILFGAYKVGYQVTYTMPYNNYPNMTFTPNLTAQSGTISGLRCSASPLDPTTAPKNLYGIELLKPNGTPYEKGSFGDANNKFFIRIGGGTNRGKICKYDTSQNVLVPMIDPGINRSNDYYFYFTASHHPSWYYMKSSLNNYAAIHNNFYIRFTPSSPQQVENDAFLWMIV